MEDFNQKKPKKMKGLLIFLLLIIIVVVVFAGYYFFKINTAKYVFESSINKLLSAENAEATVKDFKTVKASFDIGAKINSDENELENISDLINDAKLTVTSSVDTENKEEVVGLKLTKSNDKLIDAKVKIEEENKKMYVTLGELFEKTIKVDYEEALEDELEIKDANISSIGKMKNPNLAQEIIKKEIKSQIDEKYLSMEKIDVDGKKLTKNEMKLSSEDFLNIIKTIFKDLSDNEEYLACYDNKDEVKDSLKDAVDSIEKLDNVEDVNIIFDIYTSGIMKKVERVDFIVDEEGEETSIQFTKIEDGQYSYKIISENEEALGGNIKFNIENNDFSFEISMKYEETEVVVSINGSISYDEEIEKMNTKGAISLDEFTEEDTNELLNNFLESKLYEIIAEASESYYSEFELDDEDYTFDSEKFEEYDEDELIDEEENQDTKESKSDKSSTGMLKTESGDEVKFIIPKEFELDSEDGDYYKVFTKEVDDDEIRVEVSTNYQTMDEYFDAIEEKTKKYEQNKGYTNVYLTERETLKIGENEFEKVTLTYDKEVYSVTSYTKTYIAYKVDSKNIYTVEIDEADLMSDEDIEAFLTIL